MQRVETVGVYPLAPRRGYGESPRSAERNSPLWFSEKLPARQGRTRLRQFASPAQPVLKKLPPVRDEHACAVRVPAQPVLKKLPPRQRRIPSRCGSALQNKNTADPQSAVFCFIPFRQGRKTRQAARYCPRYTQSRASTPCRCRSAPVRDLALDEPLVHIEQLNDRRAHERQLHLVLHGVVSERLHKVPVQEVRQQVIVFMAFALIRLQKRLLCGR